MNDFTKAVQKNVSFPAAQIRRIQKLADAMGITFSKAVQRLCNAAFNHPRAFSGEFDIIVSIPEEEPEGENEN